MPHQIGSNDAVMQIWHNFKLSEANFNPAQSLEDILSAAIRITSGIGGLLYLGFSKDDYIPPIYHNLSQEQTRKLVEMLVQQQQLEQLMYPQYLEIHAEIEESILVAPFVDDGTVIAIIIITHRQNPHEHFADVLAVFCRQLLPIIKMCITILELLKTHKDANEAAIALKRMYEDVVHSTKLACIGELAASIAHDINTPLSGIMGFMRLFLRFLDKPDISISELKAVRHYLESAEQEVQRCQTIVRDLLRFSRKENEDFQPFSLPEIIDKSYLLLEKQLAEKSIEFHKEIPDDLPLAIGEANQIQQVIMNLLVNAKNAISQGGKITVAVEAMPEKLWIRISDDGVGIPKENLSRIFEPFYTTNLSQKGTGLGLSISKKIIDEHRGKILVQSAIDEGTTFTIELPCS